MDTTRNEQPVELAIIGTGPAGYTAAIYAARADLSPLVFEGMQPGGQLTTTTEVENFPGFPAGIDGTTLMGQMRAQAERFGARFIPVEIEKVDFSKRPFRLEGWGQTFFAKAVIVATGASARYLGLPSEENYKGGGVSACATCDGPFYRDQVVIVVGGGDSAMEEADHLSKFASKVILVHRRDSFRASRIMIERTQRNPKIEIITNAVPVEVLGDGQLVTGARLKDTTDGREWELPCQGFFLGIGHTPNTQAFKGQIELDEQGYIVPRPGSTMTSVPGVFACGDVQDRRYRQAITAAGSGCAAALDAEKWLIEAKD